MDDAAVVSALATAVGGQAGGGTTDTLAVILARVETKVDIAIQQHGQTLNDHETRIRVIEKINPIGWKALFGGLAGGLGLAAGIIGVMNALHIPL